MADPLLTVAAAAARVGRSRPTIYRWIADKDLRSFAGRVRESEVIAVERRMRTQRRAQHETRDVVILIDGERVGVVRYNPVTGKVHGALTPGLGIDELHEPNASS